jgi:prepilin-type N-terminal cleavage/methylation domain-containing protein
MIRMKNNKGFTLIETVLVMIVMGITMTPFSILVINVMQQNIRSQAWSTAVSLAEGEMERVCSLPFSKVVNESAVAFAAPFSAYSHQVAVNNVTSSALNTPVAGATNYKNVKISVNNSISGNVTLTTLVTSDW